MTNSISWIRISVNGPGTERKLHEIVQTVSGIKILKRSDDSELADLLIYELGTDVDKDFLFILSQIESNSIREVFLISEHLDQDLLLKAIKSGVREFFALPLNGKEISQALEKFKKRKKDSKKSGSNKNGQIINIIGSKGGVGATTVAVNLAVSIAREKPESSVALIDFNVLFGEIPVFLDIKTTLHWGEIVKNIDRLDATFLMNILVKHASGIYVLPSPVSLDLQHSATPDIANRMLTLMKTVFDFIIIDSGQTLNETSFQILQMSDMLLLVSNLSLPCLSNTNRLIDSFSSLGYISKDAIKVVINRYIKKSEISLDDARAGINQDLFWIIPNDYHNTMSAINQGKPIFQIAPKAAITKSFKAVVRLLFAQEEKKKKKRWNFFKSK
jgi:pilus assembly protein CpaE